MSGLYRPDRSSVGADTDTLVALEGTGRPATARPTKLGLSAINVLPSLFQPRETSLAFAPEKSRKHVADLSRAVRQGDVLDPVSVVAFGPQWFLIDGHHRVEAYREAGYRKAIPVEAHDSNLTGLSRVHWAEGQSVALNRKRKLDMSDYDKTDAAWRLVVRQGLSIAETKEQAGVGLRTVSYMRDVLKKLLAAGFYDVDELYTWAWHRAQQTARGVEPDGDLDAKREERITRLAKNLGKVINSRVRTDELYEALERVREGVSATLGELAQQRGDEGSAPSPFASLDI